MAAVTDDEHGASTGVAVEAPPSASTGRIYFWQGGSLWIGEGMGRTQSHSHHAHQLTLATSRCLRFRTESTGAWSTFEASVVPSHCTHQFELDGAPMAHLFVEPESRAGRAITARFGRQGVQALPPDEARRATAQLLQTWARRPARSEMIEAARTAVAILSGTTTEPATELDPRLVRALDYMRTHLRAPLSLGDAARQAALSESRFRHLFVAETGSSFRAYLLWLRINLAIESVMAGATWTEAAHEAGFADSAHLTRTHRRMFGIEPTAIRPES